VWNQFSYHIDNVGDDMSIPSAPAPSWSTHGSYRVNRLTDEAAVAYAPDLQIVALTAQIGACPAGTTVRARLQNGGTRGVPAGVSVAFYENTLDGTSRLLGAVRSSQRLLSGQGVWIELGLDAAPFAEATRSFEFYAVADDDGAGAGEHSECVEGNNRSPATTVHCPDFL